jgi:hypothetical protein
MKSLIGFGFAAVAFALCGPLPSFGQSGAVNPLGYTISTPRPIDPASGTTNPSVLATQKQNPYLGSTPSGKATDKTIVLPLADAISRGLRYNLGLIETDESGIDAKAQRLHALSALLPNISLSGEQVLMDQSLKEVGLKLPPIPGFPGLPATTGAFSFQDARISVEQPVYNAPLRKRYQAEKEAEQSALSSISDAKDIVVYAVGAAYFQVVADAARLETARAELASAQELDQETADRIKGGSLTGNRFAARAGGTAECRAVCRQCRQRTGKSEADARSCYRASGRTKI